MLMATCHVSALQELLGYYLGKGHAPVRFVAFLISFYWWVGKDSDKIEPL